MKHLITDKELLDYVTGRMNRDERKSLERRTLETAQSDLLLYAQLADYEATGSATDDIIGEDTFSIESAIRFAPDNFSFGKAASHKPPTDEK